MIEPTKEELQEMQRMNAQFVREVTERLRLLRLKKINDNPSDRATLEAQYGQVWDTDQLRNDFEVQGFMAPFVVVHRKSDGKVGSLEFQHYPRFYWGFRED